MSVLVGQVYNPVLYLRNKEGKIIDWESMVKNEGANIDEIIDLADKVTFQMSIATKKAFVNEGDKPNLFTTAVSFQKYAVKALYKYFGNEEAHGKAIVAYGHFNERTWTPDVNKESHKKFIHEEVIKIADLEGLGFKFAETPPGEGFVIPVPIPQVERQFVLMGWEFNDSHSTTAKPKATNTSSGPRLKLIGSTDSTAPSGAEAGAGDEVPF